MKTNVHFIQELANVISLEGYNILLKKFGIKYIISPNQAKWLLEEQKESPKRITIVTQLGKI